ncbi:M13 family metallopeptidase [Hutsoniella sourekii]|uniref:M13 family metallopeptidase n=1 Tax=Hutsoniella sourekii TaxID=87650 RepID=UPI0004867F68|nr:M13 family metallopeptidase [Hutsoniella sourekii]
MKIKPFITLSLCASLLTQVSLPSIAMASENTSDKQTQVSQADTSQAQVKDSLYQAVNQDYLNQLSIAPDQFMAGVNTEIDTRNKEILHQDLVKLGNGEIKPASPEEETMIKYYNQARDFQRRNQEGSQPAEPYLKKIQELQSFESFKQDIQEWIDSGIDLPFAITAGASLEQPENNQLRLIAPQTILPDTNLYQDPTQGQAILQAYQETAEKILEKMNYSQEEAQKLVSQAITYDQKIADQLTPSDQRRSLKDQLKEADPHKLAESTSSLDLIAIAEKKLNTKIEAANVTDSHYFDNFNQIVNEDHFEEMKSWMLVTFAVKAAKYLDDDLRSLVQNYENVKTGQEGIPDQADSAYNLVDQHFYEALGVYFGKNYFGEEAKKNVEAMTQEMIQIYKERLEKIDWLTPETRQAAIEKLDQIKLLVGYPSEYQERTKQMIVDEDKSLLENTLSIQRQEATNDLMQYGKAAENGYWSMPAYETNAYYSPSENLICLPAGILQDPYYSKDRTISENLGSIGSTIAHEISHAFDSTGAEFDSRGALRKWWTQEDYKKFQDRTKKILDQFDGLDSEYGKVNGDLTLDENIADNGGLSVALEALKRTDNYDLKEFFTSYARSWASKYTPEMGSLMIESDPHAPEQLRTDIPASNMDEFYEAFEVKEGDPMYRKPEDRFVLWK